MTYCRRMASGDSFVFADYFPWAVADPIPLDDATRRVLAYCTDAKSGWGVYDLAAVSARRSGLFDSVTIWTLLLANALNGQVTLENLADFTHERRADYASRVAAIDEDLDLAAMDIEDVDKVVNACVFGFPGVWGPKITKVGALYRPRSIPVLDGYVALAFGLSLEGFSARASEHGCDRRERIHRVVQALAQLLREQADLVSDLRGAVQPAVPEVELISNLRLIDIVIWTSQDDRMSRSGKPQDRWLTASVGDRIPLESFVPVAIDPGPATAV